MYPAYLQPQVSKLTFTLRVFLIDHPSTTPSIEGSPLYSHCSCRCVREYLCVYSLGFDVGGLGRYGSPKKEGPQYRRITPEPLL